MWWAALRHSGGWRSAQCLEARACGREEIARVHALLSEKPPVVTTRDCTAVVGSRCCIACMCVRAPNKLLVQFTRRHSSKPDEAVSEGPGCSEDVWRALLARAHACVSATCVRSEFYSAASHISALTLLSSSQEHDSNSQGRAGRAIAFLLQRRSLPNTMLAPQPSSTQPSSP